MNKTIIAIAAAAMIFGAPAHAKTCPHKNPKPGHTCPHTNKNTNTNNNRNDSSARLDAALNNNSQSDSSANASANSSAEGGNVEIGGSVHSSSYVDLGGVTQPVIPTAVSGSMVQFVPGVCGPRMKIEREWVQVGKKKHQGHYAEKITGIDFERPFEKLHGRTYGWVYTASVSVNSAAHGGGFQIGGANASGQGAFGVGGSAAGQSQQVQIIAQPCVMPEAQPAQVAPRVIYKEVPARRING